MDLEILSKLRDAASMFWQSLDEHERRYLLLVGCYLFASTFMSLQRFSRRRELDELRASLTADLERWQRAENR